MVTGKDSDGRSVHPGAAKRPHFRFRAFRNRLISRPDALFVAALFAFCIVVLLILGRGQWFWYDEWTFLTRRELWPPTEWLRPHNEHLSTIPLILYLTVFRLVGLASYWPYYVLILTAHLVTGALVYQVLRVERVPPITAATLMTLFLLLGSGAENIFWAFQIGLVGSLACFLAAIIIVSGGTGVRRDMAVGALAAGMLLFSGVGVAGLVGTAVLMLTAKRSFVRTVGVLAPAVILYGVWFMTVGREAVRDTAPVADVASASPPFVVNAFSAALAGIAGVGPVIGPTLVVMLIVMIGALLAIRGRLPVATSACLAACIAFYALTALTRAATFGPDYANQGRYVYIGAGLLIAGLGSLVGEVKGNPVARRAGLVVAAFAAVAILGNVVLLVAASRGQVAQEQEVRGRVLATAALVREQPDSFLPTAKPHPQFAPQLTLEGVQALDRRGALPRLSLDELALDVVATTTAMLRVAESKGAVVAGSALESQVIGMQDVATQVSPDGCIGLRPTGIDPFIVLAHHGSGSIQITTAGDGTTEVYVSDKQAFTPEAMLLVPTEPGRPHGIDIVAPDGGRGFLRLDPPTPNGATVCLAAE